MIRVVLQSFLGVRVRVRVRVRLLRFSASPLLALGPALLVPDSLPKRRLGGARPCSEAGVSHNTNIYNNNKSARQHSTWCLPLAGIARILVSLITLLIV